MSSTEVFSTGRVPEPTRQGTISRTSVCELMYGPMNCDGHFRNNTRVLDEQVGTTATATATECLQSGEVQEKRRA